MIGPLAPKNSYQTGILLSISLPDGNTMRRCYIRPFHAIFVLHRATAPTNLVEICQKSVDAVIHSLATSYNRHAKSRKIVRAFTARMRVCVHGSL